MTKLIMLNGFHMLTIRFPTLFNVIDVELFQHVVGRAEDSQLVKDSLVCPRTDVAVSLSVPHLSNLVKAHVSFTDVSDLERISAIFMDPCKDFIVLIVNERKCCIIVAR